MAQGKLEGFEGTKLEALVETMLLAARADDEFSDEERAHFASSIESLTDRKLAEDATKTLVAELERKIAEEGRPARLAAVRAQLDDAGSRRVAFELALAIVASDGLIRTAERELLMEVADALEVDGDVAADLVAKHHR